MLIEKWFLHVDCDYITRRNSDLVLRSKLRSQMLGETSIWLHSKIFYRSHYMISQWPKNDRFPFVSCTNNVMQHIDKLSLPVRYVIKVNTSDTLSLNKSHFFFFQFWTKNRKSWSIPSRGRVLSARRRQAYQWVPKGSFNHLHYGCFCQNAQSLVISCCCFADDGKKNVQSFNACAELLFCPRYPLFWLPRCHYLVVFFTSLLF